MATKRILYPMSGGRFGGRAKGRGKGRGEEKGVGILSLAENRYEFL